MDLRWLQDFLTLAATNNFTRAASLRNTSQTAFSRRIQALEAWAGASLFDRSTTPTRLTRAGEQFRPRAQLILQQLAAARAALR